MDCLVPVKRRDEGERAYAPQVLCGLDDIRVSEGVEAGMSGQDSESDGEKKDDSNGGTTGVQETNEDASAPYDVVR